MSEFGGTERVGPALPAPRDGDAWAAPMEAVRHAVAAVATAQRRVAQARAGQALRQAELGTQVPGLDRRTLERRADGTVAELAAARERLREAVTSYARAQRRASEVPERMLVRLKAALRDSLAIGTLPRESGVADVREEVVRWAIDAYYDAA